MCLKHFYSITLDLDLKIAFIFVIEHTLSGINLPDLTIWRVTHWTFDSSLYSVSLPRSGTVHLL